MYSHFITKKGEYFIYNDKHYFSPKGTYYKFEISLSQYVKAFRTEAQK
jgi:hypothetical protein